MKSRRLVWLISSVLVSCKSVPLAASSASPTVEVYPLVGRIRWDLSPNDGWVQGRGRPLRGAFAGGGTCEVELFTRDSGEEPRENDLWLRTVMPSLLDAVEERIQIRSYGRGVPVRYVTLTDRRKGEPFRFVTKGYYARGAIVVRFALLTNDPSGADLENVLRTVHSAEPLDSDAFLAVNFKVMMDVCVEKVAAQTAERSAAWSASRFASVDWVRGLASGTSKTQEDVVEEAARMRQELAHVFDQNSPREGEEFCRSFPTRLRTAERW